MWSEISPLARTICGQPWSNNTPPPLSPPPLFLSLVSCSIGETASDITIVSRKTPAFWLSRGCVLRILMRAKSAGDDTAEATHDRNSGNPINLPFLFIASRNNLAYHFTLSTFFQACILKDWIKSLRFRRIASVSELKRRPGVTFLITVTVQHSLKNILYIFLHFPFLRLSSYLINEYKFLFYFIENASFYWRISLHRNLSYIVKRSLVETQYPNRSIQKYL